MSRRVRHVKRGTTYHVLDVARMQTSGPISDMQDVVIYRSEDDGTIWVRPASEFNDGRFIDLDNDADTSPQAHHTTWYVCEHCSNLHIRLHEEDGCVMAVMTADERMLQRMQDTLAKGYQPEPEGKPH